MRTIVFYSFKGGTGRTLAVAQLAMVLKELKHRVVALDLDLGAPGLWERLALPMGYDPERPPDRGTGDYLYTHMNRPSLQSLRVRATSADNVELLTAGDCFARDNEYWTKYLDAEFQTFIGSDVRSDELLVKMKEKIEDEFEGPEFLLIDAPAGVSRLAAMAIELLADDVVLLTANQREGLLGTNFILRRLQDISRKRRVPDRHCVLSRLPRAYTSKEGYHLTTEIELEEQRSTALNRINLGLREGFRAPELYVFSSEPMLELKSDPLKHLPMQNAEYDASQLVQDYIEFFPRLIPEIRELASRRQDPVRQRTFLLSPLQGLMINPEDESPNVALRVDTLVSTFAAIAEVVRAYRDTDAARNVLETAGRTAAEGFATYLKKKWDAVGYSTQVTVRPAERIAEWCAFDSSVGFGVFIPKTSGDLSGEVVLQNNFLVFGRVLASGSAESGDEASFRNYNEVQLCSLMTGYIERVMMSIFPQRKVIVEHKYEDCAQFYPNPKTECRFTYSAGELLSQS